MFTYQAYATGVALYHAFDGSARDGGAVAQRYRAWPRHCDANLHITNAKYLTFMDFGRAAWLASSGILIESVRRRIPFVVGGISITYRRSIDIMQPFSVHTRAAHVDERWITFVQTFTLGDGRTAARAVARGTFSGRAGTLDPRELASRVGCVLPNNDLASAEVDAWMASSEATLAEIRRADRPM